MTRLAPFLAALLSVVAVTAARAAAPVALTPAPAAMVAAEGGFALTPATRIFITPGDAEARDAAAFLAELLAKARGLRPAVVEGAPRAGEAGIVLARGGPAAADAYGLTVAPGGVTVTATTRGGLLYGAVSVWQLATPAPGRGAVALPALRLDDAPRFPWRGLMIDSARHYQAPATLRAMIDAMAAHKLNVLHWHLTDDQGWRLQINKYPKLTEIGAWRAPAGAAGRDPRTGKAVRYGGFYSQDQVRALVAYASARNITIVPEIDMPGHALAAITAYPKLGVSGLAPTDAMSDWGVYPYLYNIDDPTFTVLTDVLDEVMDLFPGPYIHVGGDEAVKDQWKASPAVQAKMKALGLADEHALQSWFIQRLEHHLNAHGRRLIGWDEILEGGLAADATVMSWRGIDGAVAAAKAGHDAVLSPWPLLYLDNRQSASADEPPGRGRVVSLKDVYDFDPAPAALTEAERKHILGLQANAWTEHMRTDQRLELMTFPRLAAVAERGWSPKTATDWTDFSRRLPAEFTRLKALGVAADAVPFEPEATLMAAGDGQLSATLAAGLPVGEIRYTTDGAEPTAASPVYAAPLTLKAGTPLRARTFVDGQPLGRTRAVALDPAALLTRTSHQLKACSDKLTLSLEDDAPATGDRAVFLVDLFNPCWLWTGADLSRGARLTARVGQVPFNFQVGADRAKIPLRAPATPEGELEVRLDACDGETVAVLPIGAAAKNPALSTLSGQIAPRPGRHDLCLAFTSRSVDPTWAIDRVTLTPGAAR